MKYEAKGITIEISHGSCVVFSECRDNCPADVFEPVNSKVTAPIVWEYTECCLCVGNKVRIGLGESILGITPFEGMVQ